MAIRKVFENDKFREGNPFKKEILIEADEQKDLADDTTLRALATKAAAALGLRRVGTGMITSPFPVDAEGKTSDELYMGPKENIVGWRAGIVVQAAEF